MTDHTVMIARLRNAGIDASDDWAIMQAAADALEAATPSEREKRLEKALQEILWMPDDGFISWTKDIARTALAEQGEKK